MKFDMVMICPPWKWFTTYRTRPVILSDVMPPKIWRALDAFEFIAHALHDFTAGDHLIFVWTPGKHSVDCREYMTRLGYEMQGTLMWVRPKWKPGSGEKAVEFLLIGSKGKRPALSDDCMNRIGSAFTGSVKNRIEKPKDAYEFLESEFPYKEKLQLYGWNQRPGWTLLHKNGRKIK